MFGSKSAGIVEEMLSAFPVVRKRAAQVWLETSTVAPEMPGSVRRNETYIARTQFTVVSMPFFRWSQ